MNLNDMIAKALENPEVKKEYDALEVEYSIKKALLIARKEKNITQEQLAEITGIDRTDISELERGEGNPTIATLQRLADGLGKQLKLDFC